MQYKYHAAVRRLARGGAHSYNNIFTGLGGQTAMLQRESSLPDDSDNKRGNLIDELLQRGGHMVFCVDFCAEALEEYTNLHDIITTVLLDIGLRDASGYDCRCKLLSINPKARIIFMSGQLEHATGAETEKAVYNVHL